MDGHSNDKHLAVMKYGLMNLRKVTLEEALQFQPK